MPPVHFPVEVFGACPSRRRPKDRPRIGWRDYISWIAWESLGLVPIAALSDEGGVTLDKSPVHHRTHIQR